MANNSTPFFPSWRHRLAPAGSRSRSAAHLLGSLTLSKLEKRFGHLLPDDCLATPDNGRDRIYTVARTFWCFLWQVLHPGTPNREITRQVQALSQLSGGPNVASEDSAYCTARTRLRSSVLEQILQALAKALWGKAPAQDPAILQGRRLKVLDGTTVTLPDTKRNRARYPKIQLPAQATGFPMMRVLVVFCLASGAVLTRLTGSLLVSELRLMDQLIAQLSQGDIVVGDRGFGNFIVLALLQAAGIDFIGRSNRKADGRRRLRRLGPQDWLMDWRRSYNKSPLLSRKRWRQLPVHLTVRIVRGSLWRPGFRVRQITAVTTLRDATLYPAHQILEAYARRWRLELCFDDLKTTLGMETLSCHSPAMVGKELDMHLMAYNLVRFVMAQAAQTHSISLEEISFKGTLDALRQFCHAMCQTRSHKLRRLLWQQLLQAIVDDPLPHRPNRREPRAVKRQKHKYPHLDRPRHKFRDLPKRQRRRALARKRALI
jgi:Transposase DDE domain